MYKKRMVSLSMEDSTTVQLPIYKVTLTGTFRLSGIYTAIFSSTKHKWFLITEKNMQAVNHNRRGPLS